MKTKPQSLPYRPFPPICTISESKRNLPPVPPPALEPIEGDLPELTATQLSNWRKVIAIQFNPFIAQFVSDEDVLWYRNQLQAAIKERVK